MATETLKIEAIVEGANQEVLQKMRADLDNLSASTGRGTQASMEHAEATGAMDRGLNLTWQTMKSFGAAYGAIFSVQAIASWSASAVSEFENYEQAMQRVTSASGILGQNEDLARFKIAATTDELQKRTTFDNTQQLEALNSLILSTQDYDRAMSALPITLDVAAAHGLDAATAGRMVGMALEGNMSMISRYVPALRGLSGEEKNVANISRILEQTYSGRAEAMAQITTGRFKIMKNQLNDYKKSLGEFLSFTAFDLLTGRATLAGAQGGVVGALPGRRQQELQVSPMFSGPIPQAMHELGVMTNMSQLSFQRWKIEQDITAELQKGGAKYEDILTKSLKILDIQKEEKKVRQDIAGLIARRGVESIGELGDFISALGDVQKKFPGELPAVNVRVGDRFLSSKELTGEEQGVSRFSMFQEELLREQLTRKGLPSGLRADIAGQLFQANLSQLKQATTPEMAGRQLEESVQSFNELQTEKAAQLGEEIAERKALVDNTALTNQELQQIRGMLERIAGYIAANPKGFETVKRNELE